MEEILRSNEVNKVTMVEFFLHHSGPISLSNALLSSVNARVNADAQCEYTFKQIVRISF